MADELADRRLWLTADSTELVEEGDPDAAFLAAIPGRPLPDVPVRKRPEPKQEPAPQNKADDAAESSKPKRTSSRKRGGVKDGD